MTTPLRKRKKRGNITVGVAGNGLKDNAVSSTPVVSLRDSLDYAREFVNDAFGPIEIELTDRFGQTWPEWLVESWEETRRHAIVTVADAYSRGGDAAAAAALPPVPTGVHRNGLVVSPYRKGFRG